MFPIRLWMRTLSCDVYILNRQSAAPIMHIAYTVRMVGVTSSESFLVGSPVSKVKREFTVSHRTTA